MSLHPLSKFLEPWFAEGEPTLAKLNEAVQLHGVKRGGGLPLRFVRPVTDDLHYEERIFRFGAVATRENNAHDLFNALIWLTFPQTKVVLNRRHVLALREQGSTVRGPLRDALTQFDECGVIVAGTSPELWEAICAHRWHEAFVTRREELCRTTRFIVFGHASHEALISPFNGLCGKALFLPMTEASLARFDHAGNAVMDELLAHRLTSADFSPRDWQPLPLLGIPGATAKNKAADYYADTRQFRPARTMPSGSSPGSRWMPTQMRHLEESPGPIEQDAG